MSEYIITRYDNPDELIHYGIPGMKWGKRKSSYSSTGIRSAIARRRNEKVDAGFKNWGENTKKKANAVELGKKANVWIGIRNEFHCQRCKGVRKRICWRMDIRCLRWTDWTISWIY